MFDDIPGIQHLSELCHNVRDAIHCHFEEDSTKITRIHFTKEAVFAV